MTTEQRLARLERENRWTKGIAVALALALGVVLFVAAGQDQEEGELKVLDEVRARKLILMNKQGYECAKFTSDPYPEIMLYNHRGATVVISAAQDRTFMELITGKGIYFGAGIIDTSAGISCVDPQNHRAFSLNTCDASTGLALFTDGRERARLENLYGKRDDDCWVHRGLRNNGLMKDRTDDIDARGLTMCLRDKDGKITFKAPK